MAHRSNKHPNDLVPQPSQCLGRVGSNNYAHVSSSMLSHNSHYMPMTSPPCDYQQSLHVACHLLLEHVVLLVYLWTKVFGDFFGITIDDFHRQIN